jgi:hypothetical protein
MTDESDVGHQQEALWIVITAPSNWGGGGGMPTAAALPVFLLFTTCYITKIRAGYKLDVP